MTLTINRKYLILERICKNHLFAIVFLIEMDLKLCYLIFYCINQFIGYFEIEVEFLKCYNNNNNANDEV